MSSRREAPQPWADAMIARGLVHGRRPSMRALAIASGIAPQTVINLVFGQAATEVEAIEAVAGALGISPETASAWAGRARAVRGPWTPPSEASQLTEPQRGALDQLIRVMTNPESEASSDAATMTPHHLHAQQRGEKSKIQVELGVKPKTRKPSHPKGS